MSTASPTPRGRRWTLISIGVVIAAMLHRVGAVGPQGDHDADSVTLGRCDDIPSAIAEMRHMRDRLEDGNFTSNVTGVVTDTYDLLEPMYADARRAVGAEDFEPYEQVGAYVQGAWVAYLEMDTVDARSGYLAYGESIARMRLAEQTCEDLDEHG